MAVAPLALSIKMTKVQSTKNVGREMVEKAGVDVDQLIDKLKKAAAAEFTTYYYYTLLRTHSSGLEGEGIKEIVEDARLEVDYTSKHLSRVSMSLEVSFTET